MKISVAQIEAQLGAVEENLDRIQRFAKAACEDSCDVLVFPEMSDTGYEMEAILASASSWDEAPFLTVQSLVRELGIYLLCGLSERSGDDIYNSIAVFNPQGELLAKHRKTHLFSAAPVYEDRYLSPGDQLSLVEVGGLKCGVIVCYELRFPEITRLLMLSGAEVIFVPSAFPFPRENHWRILTASRAIENQAYVVAANRVGTNGPLTFCGLSQILDPDGSVLASAGTEEEALITAHIEIEKIKENEINSPQDRREDLYRRWSKDI